MGALQQLAAFKDAATVLLSASSFLLACSVFVFNTRVQHSKRTDDARKSFEDAILGLSKARQDISDLENAHKDDPFAPATVPRRVEIADRRNFFLSKAQQALKTARFPTGSADNLLIAVALIDSGRVGSAIEFYERSLAQASDPFEEATARRVLGRAYILVGNAERGRAEMLGALETFRVLEADKRFEDVRMRREQAETYRRLIEAERAVGRTGTLDADLEAMADVVRQVGEPQKRFFAAYLDHVRRASQPGGATAGPTEAGGR